MKVLSQPLLLVVAEGAVSDWQPRERLRMVAYNLTGKPISGALLLNADGLLVDEALDLKLDGVIKTVEIPLTETPPPTGSHRVFLAWRPSGSTASQKVGEVVLEVSEERETRVGAGEDGKPPPPPAVPQSTRWPAILIKPPELVFELPCFGEFSFFFESGRADSVGVIGNFNDWSHGLPLLKEGDVFRGSIPLRDGLLQYQFLVDGDPIPDRFRPNREKLEPRGWVTVVELKRYRRTVRIRNEGDEPTILSLQSEIPWLAVEPTGLRLEVGRQAEIKVSVNPDRIDPECDNIGTVSICDRRGGRAHLPVLARTNLKRLLPAWFDEDAAAEAIRRDLEKLDELRRMNVLPDVTRRLDAWRGKLEAKLRAIADKTET